MRFRLITLLACMVLALAMLAACDSGGQEAMQQQIDSKNAEIAALKATVENMESMSSQMEGSRLQTVKGRGTLICASNNSLAGFGFIDDSGNTVGFDIDLCRAVAAAVLGDANAVEFRPRLPANAVRRCSPAKWT